MHENYYENVFNSPGKKKTTTEKCLRCWTVLLQVNITTTIKVKNQVYIISLPFI